VNAYAIGFDNMNGRLSDESEAGNFRVGDAYPCWFDPNDPENAILVRRFRPRYYAAAAIPAFMTLITTSMLLGVRRESRKRREPPKSGMLTPDFTARSRIRFGAVLLSIALPLLLGIAFVLLRNDQLFFAAFAVAAAGGLVWRMLLFLRMRHLADPAAQRDGSRVFVTLATRVPLERVTIAIEHDGDRETRFEAHDVRGEIREWIDVARAAELIVIQRANGREVETAFRLH
jgi:hypothetical protein